MSDCCVAFVPGSGSGGGGSDDIGVNVADEGVILPSSPFTTLNFIGNGVVATDGGGGVADITIDGVPLFTPGSVIFADGAGELAEDNANFFWDNTNNRLGINTNAPGEALHVVGNAHITGKLTVDGAIDPTSLTLVDAGNAAFIENADGQSAAVSAANRGRFRYNALTQKWQASENGAAYANIISGTGTGMAIGNTIGNGPTVGSVLFVGAAGVLAQDNPNIFWDDTNNRLGLGNAAPTTTLDITGTTTTTTLAATTVNTTTANLAATGFLSAANGSAAAVSGANTGRLRYNTTGQVFQVSLNGAAYADLVSGTGTGMAIGNAIGNGPTSGSMLYVGAGGVLAQTVATTTRYVPATNNLQIGADAVTANLTNFPLTASNGVAADNVAYFWNTSTSGYSAFGALTSARAFAVSFGFGNSAVAAPLTSMAFTSVGASFDYRIVDSSNDIFLFRCNSVSSDRGRFGIYPSNVAVRSPLDFIDVLHLTSDGSTGGVRAQNNAMATGGRVSGLSAADEGAVVRGFYGAVNPGSGAGTSIAIAKNFGTTPGVLAGTNASDVPWVFQSQVTSGYSGVGFTTSVGLPQSTVASIGVGQSAAGIVDFRATPFLFCGSGADWIIGNATGALIRFGTVNATTFMQMANGSSAAVSAANTGRLRYNTTGQIFQVSLNGAAYTALTTGGGTGMVIGNTITSATEGSVLFAGAAGVLAQDNAGLFFDAASNLLGVGTNTPNAPLDVENDNPGGFIMRACNLDDTGFSAILFADDAGATQGALGFANGGAGSPMDGTNYWSVAAVAVQQIQFADATAVSHRFGVAATEAYFQIADGEAGGTGTAGTARIRYNDTAKTLQVSLDGGAYVTIVTI